MVAKAKPDGTLYNPETAPKTLTTGRVYTSLFVRHWDVYESSNKNALWYGGLHSDSDGKFKLSPLVNALSGTGLESPISPEGGKEHFDIGAHGIIFVAK